MSRLIARVGYREGFEVICEVLVDALGEVSDEEVWWERRGDQIDILTDADEVTTLMLKVALMQALGDLRNALEQAH